MTANKAAPSPNVTGELWVNGRHVSYPPRVVRVPAGRAIMEIRVDGEVRRRQQGLVRPGHRKRLDIP